MAEEETQVAADASHEDDEIHHFEYQEDVPKTILKYWQQRHFIFSKYDDGIWMTDDAWFGVTPEPVANKIAAHVAAAAPSSKSILIDCFAGAGGNAIAFARSGRWDQIFAIEKDSQVLQCAKHNAAVYGVQSNIYWIHGDCFEEIAKRFGHIGKDAVVFGSPPWGGPGYRDAQVFNLSTMLPYSVDEIMTKFCAISTEVVLYLPRTSDLNQLARYAKEESPVQVMHYCIKGASKALCIYYGDFRPL